MILFFILYVHVHVYALFLHRRPPPPSSPSVCRSLLSTLVWYGQRTDLLLDIFITDTSLHRGPGGNAIDPLEQVWEVFDVLLCESAALPALDPRPRLDIGDAVFALTSTDQVVSRFARVFSRQTDLEHAEDTEGFVFVAVDGV